MSVENKPPEAVKPLWYQIINGNFGYKEFCDRYHMPSSSEEFTVPSFFLCIVHNLDVYVDGDHVLLKLSEYADMLDERDLAYFFIYWVLTGKLSSERASTRSLLQMKFQYVLPHAFSSKIKDIVNALTSYLLGVTVDKLSIPSIDNFEMVRFLESIEKEGFSYEHTVAKEVRALCQMRNVLLDMKAWYTQKIIPSSYNISVVIIKNPPRIWGQITDDTMKRIIKMLDLYIKSEYDFVDYMIAEISKYYPEYKNELSAIIVVDNQRDVHKVSEYLRSISPQNRMEFIPSLTPVFTSGIIKFTDMISKCGIDETLHTYIGEYRDSILTV